jgi:predicted nucleic acid-binding protein
MRYLDSNVFLRYLLDDDPVRSNIAVELLERIDHGDEVATTGPLVIFEVIFTLQRRLKLPNRTVRELLTYILEMQNLRLPERALLISALDLYVELNIPFGDAYIAVSMMDQGIGEIYSWDADYDRVAGISPIEPGAIT